MTAQQRFERVKRITELHNKVWKRWVSTQKPHLGERSRKLLDEGWRLLGKSSVVRP